MTNTNQEAITEILKKMVEKPSLEEFSGFIFSNCDVSLKSDSKLIKRSATEMKQAKEELSYLLKSVLKTLEENEFSCLWNDGSDNEEMIIGAYTVESGTGRRIPLGQNTHFREPKRSESILREPDYTPTEVSLDTEEEKELHQDIDSLLESTMGGENK